LGLEARTVRDLDLLGAPDHEILERAIEHDAILLTRDLPDFFPLAQLYRAVDKPIPGILLVPPSIPQQNPGALVKAVIQWAGRYGARQEIVGGIEWLPAARSDEGDQQVRESRPRYLRALERIGATI
jgi:predicted nuclease of predicted toxin-antitoxin system